MGHTGGGTRTSTFSMWTQQTRGWGRAQAPLTHTQASGRGTAPGPWAPHPLRVDTRHHPPVASGPALVTPRSAVGPFSQSTFVQMPGGVRAPPPQDGLGGVAPPPSATASGLCGLEAPEISGPRGGRGLCSAPWLFLS